jgi:hypothetical protein
MKGLGLGAHSYCVSPSGVIVEGACAPVPSQRLAPNDVPGLSQLERIAIAYSESGRARGTC